MGEFRNSWIGHYTRVLTLLSLHYVPAARTGIGNGQKPQSINYELAKQGRFSNLAR